MLPATDSFVLDVTHTVLHAQCPSVAVSLDCASAVLIFTVLTHHTLTITYLLSEPVVHAGMLYACWRSVPDGAS